MHAVILAGGKGTRLAPYTITFPKPMVPVGDMPILEIVMYQLKHAGFTKVTMAVGHLAELMMAYFGNGEKWGVEIEYSREEQPLGTVGPLALIDELPETFLVMNGDVLTTLKYDEIYQQHLENGADLTIGCCRCNTKIDLGVIEFDGRMIVNGYREKPVLPYDVSMGVYVFNKSILNLFAPGEYMDFPTVVNKLIQGQGIVKAYLSEVEWLDIGRPDDYALATERFNELKHKFLPGLYAANNVKPKAVLSKDSNEGFSSSYQKTPQQMNMGVAK